MVIFRLFCQASIIVPVPGGLMCSIGITGIIEAFVAAAVIAELVSSIVTSPFISYSVTTKVVVAVVLVVSVVLHVFRFSLNTFDMLTEMEGRWLCKVG